MAAGADCDHTLSDQPRSMSLDEFIKFLEPQFEVKDPKTGKVVSPARGAALCQSADDWNSLKTSLEQACKKMGNLCKFEIQKKIADAGNRLDALQYKLNNKKKKATSK